MAYPPPGDDHDPESPVMAAPFGFQPTPQAAPPPPPPPQAASQPQWAAPSQSYNTTAPWQGGSAASAAPSSAGGYGASAGGAAGVGFGGGGGGMGGDMMVSQQSSAMMGGAKWDDDDEDEPPLLEELGINWSHIWSKMGAVLVPNRELTPEVLEDTDFAGPLVFCIALGFCLLLSGKVHFGYIYGIFAMSCIAVYCVLNLMAGAARRRTFSGDSGLEQSICHDMGFAQVTAPTRTSVVVRVLLNDSSRVVAPARVTGASSSGTRNGQFFWAAYPAGSQVPTADAVRSGAGAEQSGNGPWTSRSAAEVNATGLQPDTLYDLFVVAEDVDGRWQDHAVAGGEPVTVARLRFRSEWGIGLMPVFSIQGYCLLPVTLLSALAVLVSLQGVLGGLLGLLAIAWCTVTSTRFFDKALNMSHHRYLIAYPVLLQYACFALITIF